MKKSLFTLAVLSAFAAPAMAADVTIYGVVDVGFDRVKSGNTTVTGIESGLASDSRIGFKGTESLGGGWTASFVLEQALSIDNGGETMGSGFRRQAWAGLGNKEVGEVRLGRQHTPLYVALEQVDPFKVGLAGNAVNMMGMGAYQIRTNNAVTYIAPSVGGFSGQAQYAFGETDEGASKNGTFGFNGGYSVGDLDLTVAYSNQKYDVAGFDDKKTDLLVGGVYDFKSVKAHVAYNQTKYEEGTTFEGKVNNFLLGVSVPMGKHNLMASYIRNEVKDVDQAKTNQFALGYTYGMSKRTKLYASYAHVSNDDNVALQAVALGENTTRFNAGVSHSF